MAVFLLTGITYQHFVAGLPTAINLAFAGFPFPLMHCNQHIWGYSVINVFFAAVVYWSISSKNHWLVANPVITDIGRISYGMYVLHVCMMSLFLHLFAGQLALVSVPGVLIYLAMLYTISKLVFVLLENPFLALKRRFAP